MITVTADEAAKDWRKLADAAQHEPVRVLEGADAGVVVLSVAEYERFRRLIGQRLMETMDRMGAKAKAAGLTEDKLDELLADES